MLEASATRVAAAAAREEPREAAAASTLRRVPPQMSGDQEADNPPFQRPWDVVASNPPSLLPPMEPPTVGKRSARAVRSSVSARAMARAAVTISGFAEKPRTMRPESWGSPKQFHQAVRSSVLPDGGMLFTHVTGSPCSGVSRKFGPNRHEVGTQQSRKTRRRGKRFIDI